MQQVSYLRRVQIGHVPRVQLRDRQHRYGTVIRLGCHEFQRALPRGADPLKGLSFLRGDAPAAAGGLDPSFQPRIRRGQRRVDSIHYMRAVAVGPRLVGGPQQRTADRTVYDRCAGVLTGAVFDTNPRMGSGERSSRDEADTDPAETRMETGRGLDLLDAVAGTWGVATVGDRGKWVWFQVHAA